MFQAERNVLCVIFSIVQNLLTRKYDLTVFLGGPRVPLTLFSRTLTPPIRITWAGGRGGGKCPPTIFFQPRNSLSLENKNIWITVAERGVMYRVSIKSFPHYKHLLQENYVEYKLFLPLLKLVSKKKFLLELHFEKKKCLYST
jgi:hypothetical protein